MDNLSENRIELLLAGSRLNEKRLKRELPLGLLLKTLEFLIFYLDLFDVLPLRWGKKM